jgi:hypothetical protein
VPVAHSALFVLPPLSRPVVIRGFWLPAATIPENVAPVAVRADADTVRARSVDQAPPTISRSPAVIPGLASNTTDHAVLAVVSTPDENPVTMSIAGFFVTRYMTPKQLLPDPIVTVKFPVIVPGNLMMYAATCIDPVSVPATVVPFVRVPSSVHGTPLVIGVVIAALNGFVPINRTP